MTLTICVSDSGRPTDVKVAKTSGFDKLDEAAVKDVQRNWRFVPGKEDGKPDCDVQQLHGHVQADRLRPAHDVAARCYTNKFEIELLEESSPWPLNRSL